MKIDAVQALVSLGIINAELIDVGVIINRRRKRKGYVPAKCGKAPIAALSMVTGESIRCASTAHRQPR